MDEKEYKKILLIVLFAALLVFAYIIIKPLFIPILFGLLLGYIFYPLYKIVYKRTGYETLSALFIVIGILIIILLPIVFLIPIITRQMINVYIVMQNLDLSLVLQQAFPSMFGSLSSSADIAAVTSSFTADIASFFLKAFQDLIFNLPAIILQTVIILFTFFFSLRDYEKMSRYFIAISPLSSDSHQKFYNKFKQVTNSIIYGQIIIGIVQGIIAGIGYFIFGVPNALLLTLLTALVGIIPVIGPWFVWVPIDVYLFMSGNTGAAIGLLIYGLLVINWVDSLIRPLIVSRMAKMNSAIALIGMVGGLFAFGIMGLIIGPLVLAYLLLIAEFYKERKVKSILIEEAKPEPKRGSSILQLPKSR